MDSRFRGNDGVFFLVFGENDGVFSAGIAGFFLPEFPPFFAEFRRPPPSDSIPAFFCGFGRDVCYTFADIFIREEIK